MKLGDDKKEKKNLDENKNGMVTENRIRHVHSMSNDGIECRL
jgi:hypothetical protein